MSKRKNGRMFKSLLTRNGVSASENRIAGWLAVAEHMLYVPMHDSFR